ncbi:conserved hypothetical protein [Bacillus mycoides]|uniref:Uncharacterized protein n=1 Tax=Bacillus mycoides TaxID=1405 RepID=A0A653Z7H5_BACMY|nr:conserved hypothetical protein [Bacillus mycoides]
MYVFIKQMNAVRFVIYGTINMDSDRDKGYIKYSSFFSKRGVILCYTRI